MSYFEVMLEARSTYSQAVSDKDLNMYWVFAYVYDEMSCFLQSADDRMRAEAFTALFVVAVMDGLEFVSDDPFTQDVFEELSTVYSRVSSLGLDVKRGDDEKLMLQHVETVSIYTGIVVGCGLWVVGCGLWVEVCTGVGEVLYVFDGFIF